MKINYATWIREVIGIREEEIDLPNIATLDQLIDYLEKSGEGHKAAFQKRHIIFAESGGRVLKTDQVLGPDIKEITFFSPIAGG